MLKLFSVVFLLIILVIGCNKNKTTTEEKANPVNIQKIESVVKYCTDRVQNSLKTTDSIPVDSVVYYLEATSNYSYGIASAHGDSQKTDSSFFTVQFDHNKAAIEDVRAAYGLMMDSIRASYYLLSCVNKNLVSVHVSLVGKDEGLIMLKAVSVIIYGNNSSFGTFDTTDYWIYRGADQCYGGKCGPYAGTGDPCLDAARKIQNSIMLRKGTSQGCYVPPFTTVQLYPTYFPNPWFQGTNYNYFRYLFFYNSPGWGNYHSCLMPFEMNRFLGYAEYCVFTEDTQPSGARPGGFSFINIELKGDLSVGGGTEVHKGKAHYGIYLSGGYQYPL